MNNLRIVLGFPTLVLVINSATESHGPEKPVPGSCLWGTFTRDQEAGLHSPSKRVHHELRGFHRTKGMKSNSTVVGSVQRIRDIFTPALVVPLHVDLHFAHVCGCEPVWGGGSEPQTLIWKPRFPPPLLHMKPAGSPWATHSSL